MVTVGDLVAPLHNKRLLGLSLFANFILVPLIAVALIILIPMNPESAARPASHQHRRRCAIDGKGGTVHRGQRGPGSLAIHHPDHYHRYPYAVLGPLHPGRGPG